jgi:hypothetical protein
MFERAQILQKPTDTSFSLEIEVNAAGKWFPAIRICRESPGKDRGFVATTAT